MLSNTTVLLQPPKHIAPHTPHHPTIVDRYHTIASVVTTSSHYYYYLDLLLFNIPTANQANPTKMKMNNFISHVAMTSTVFSTFVIAQSPNCGWQTIDLDPTSPTYNPTGSSCAEDKCCSIDGFCTRSTSDCQAGCQSNFGTCDSPLCGIEAEGDTLTNCWGTQCCSAEGFCATDGEG